MFFEISREIIEVFNIHTRKKKAILEIMSFQCCAVPTTLLLRQEKHFAFSMFCPVYIKYKKTTTYIYSIWLKLSRYLTRTGTSRTNLSRVNMQRAHIEKCYLRKCLFKIG